MRYVLIVAVLAGCAAPERYWVRPGSTQEQFGMDQGQCQAQAFSYGDVYRAALVFNACMRGKGWNLVER